MASRCINTLNDLDKISDRIYFKHSKGRFRASIEAKLKVAREKAERSLRDIDEESSSSSHKTTPSYRSSVRASSSTPSSRTFSTSASTASRSVTSERQNKVGKEKIQKPSTTKSTANGQRNRIQRRKTKSCPSCSIANKTEEKGKACKSDVPYTVSFFGKYNGKESEYEPTAWFNLPQETSVGVIDTLACDSKNKKPVCYSVDVKKGESVPNLLRHNLQVRVGQNGVVRTEKKMAITPETGNGNGKQGKKRTAPLNWEEQLNWQNACVISSELQSEGDSSSKGLCETHPVIFHERKAQQRNDYKRNEGTLHSPAYKVGLEARWVYPDRRNLVSAEDKCITAVEVEDHRSDEHVKVGTRSRRHTQHDIKDTAKEGTQQDEERVPKRVSFEDEGAMDEKYVGNTEGMKREESEARKLEDVTTIIANTDDTKKGGFDNNRKVRPKTSRERSGTHEVIAEVRKVRRPHTAPPAPPTSPRVQTDSRFSICMPIKIKLPTQGDMTENSNDPNVENETADEPEKTAELSVSVTPEESEENLVENEDCPAFSVDISTSSSPEKIVPKRVSFSNAPKSAPVSRTTPRGENETLRSKSSTALSRRPYRPPSPVVLMSESSLELPKDLPPAQAVVALRRRIREDLAQQNRELQLDIQHLYLRKHTE